MTRRAVIGLDGLDVKDLDEYDIGGEWHEHGIETVAHTCPSWNAIFSGKERDDICGFFKIPDEYESGNSIASQSSTQWTYEELYDGEYIWDNYDVDVVSAPVVLPTYSTVWEQTPLEYGWPATKDEITKSIDALGEKTMEFNSVITVFPVPDKCNHLDDNSEKDYSSRDRHMHMDQVMSWLNDVFMEVFDEWIIVSDHGLPSRREWVTDDLWVASHNDVGLVRSNAVDLSDVETNLDIHGAMERLFDE